MKKLFDNFTVTILLMFAVSLLDYIALPLIDLGVGFLLCWLYGLSYVILKGKGKI